MKIVQNDIEVFTHFHLVWDHNSADQISADPTEQIDDTNTEPSGHLLDVSKNEEVENKSAGQMNNAAMQYIFRVRFYQNCGFIGTT